MIREGWNYFMEKERILHILELEELTDERTVKSAYMTKLKRTNP